MPTEPPKRRGRPPGSKNQPRLKSGNSFGPTRTVTTGLRIIPPGDPVPFDQAGYVEAIAGPTPVRIVLSARRREAAFGDPNSADEHEIEWPSEWRLPMPGDSVHLRKDWGGFVASCDFDLEAGVVRVFLR